MSVKNVSFRSAICGAVLSAIAFLASGSADALTIIPVSQIPSNWALGVQGPGIAWALPKGASDDQFIAFFVDAPVGGLTPTPAWFTINETDGSTSDIFNFSNDCSFCFPDVENSAILRFFSDRGIQRFDPLAQHFPPDPDGNLCIEDPVNGCTSDPLHLTLEDAFGLPGVILTVEVGSAGTGFFDPFGFGFDSDDQIRFTCNCALRAVVPEPGSLSLFLTALIAGGFGLIWRARTRRFGAA